MRSNDGWLASLGPRLSGWFERWLPEAFALGAVFAAASVSIGNSPAQTPQEKA